MDKNSIGYKIKYYRKMKKLIQGDLATAIGKSSKSTISSIENGTFYPEINTLLKIAEVLDVSMDDLMTDDISAHNEQFKNTNDTLFEIFEKLPALDEKSLLEYQKMIDGFDEIFDEQNNYPHVKRGVFNWVL